MTDKQTCDGLDCAWCGALDCPREEEFFKKRFKEVQEKLYSKRAKEVNNEQRN